MMSVTAAIRRLPRAVLDFLIPPLCFGCDEPITEAQTLCAKCWKNIHFVAPPFCARCGAPFDLPVEEGTLCGACIEHDPAFTSARSALIYDDASKPIILKLKHADRLHPVPALANWMVRAAGSILKEADLIIPVPLHRWRLLRRRYNQSSLLAQAIAKQTEKFVCVDALVRVRSTPSQGQLNRKQRYANITKAFVLRDGMEIKGKSIVLVDDVLTSGATVNECAKVLHAAGAASVYVVTLARVRIAS